MSDIDDEESSEVDNDIYLEDYVSEEDDDEDQEEMDAQATSKWLKSADYAILSSDRLIQVQQEAIDKVSEVLGIGTSVTRMLLMQFQWDVERLLTVYFEQGKEKVLEICGVKDRTLDQKEVGNVECPTCFEEVPANEATRLNCGHFFCNSCWTTYVSMKIQEGQSKKIKCMAQKCNVLMDETLVPDFVEDKLLKKYNASLIDSYVEDNPNVKWCPSVPHCGNAAQVQVGNRGCVDVYCDCGWEFCFNCGDEMHSPCSCDMKKQWRKKCEDDSETCNYLAANTKDCPKCGKSIEKDGGCNLVTCRCGQHMCWLCGAPTGSAHTWTSIEGHSCNKYTEETTNKVARTTLKRYLHYWERFKANYDSVKTLKQKLTESVLEKVDVLMANHDTNTHPDVLFHALEQLFQCRRILAFSYVFGYYMFDIGQLDETPPEPEETQSKKPKKNTKKRSSGQLKAAKEEEKVSRMAKEERESEERARLIAHKNLFEDQQEQLEIATERLSKYLEMPSSHFVNNPSVLLEIVGSTAVNDRRCQGLFDTIQNDILGSGIYGYNISHYIPNTGKSYTWNSAKPSTIAFQRMLYQKSLERNSKFGEGYQKMIAKVRMDSLMMKEDEDLAKALAASAKEMRVKQK